MTKMTKRASRQTLAAECHKTLRRIESQNQGIEGLSYFLETAADWQGAYEDAATGQRRRPATPRVVVLGFGVPEQILEACGSASRYLLGGSLASCQWSDELMPRDSDPASRSIMGYAERLAGQAGFDTLFVVPVATDSLRKIAYTLRLEGRKVHPLEIPPEGASLPAQRAWEESLLTLADVVSRHMGRRITAGTIRKADAVVSDARAALLELEQVMASHPGILGGEASILVQNSYYLTDDLATWAARVHSLAAELRTRTTIPRVDRAPRVLVVGSPILFPQYKVPALIHESGLELLATIDAATAQRHATLDTGERRGSRARLIGTIARKHYAFDASSAHVVNYNLEQYLLYLLSSYQVDGVICHILKGQIEYDFELARLEGLLDERGIPLFRLETDYQQQDVEQLRIRLEAFSEMLGQRSFAPQAAGNPSARMRRGEAA